MGRINLGIQSGSLEVDEAPRQINEFLEWIQGVEIESTPVTRAEFNAEDSIRARGMGIRLDD